MSLKKEKIMSQEAVKISKIKLSNYNFFYGNFELPVNGKNLLVYGENGSGKSTIYKALELLTKDNFTDLDKSLNVFADNENVEIEFEFTNNKPSLLITSDVEQKPEGYEFLNGLSVFSPLLDYKKLLKVHYSPTKHPISTPTAAGIIAPLLGITEPTVAPIPRCTSGIAAIWL
jgi:energy-coupling factor transporter ATP-binding protein EcfA2